MGDGHKIQASVPVYHKWVIAKLVGLEGRNESDVVARVLGYWINQREDWLEKRGISFSAFRAEANAEGEEGKLSRFQANGDD